MQRILDYFRSSIRTPKSRSVGAEVETQFVDETGHAIQTQISQKMLGWLAENGWNVDCRKGNLITTLVDQNGNRIFYELGRHNMEVSTVASTSEHIFDVVNICLAQLYDAARRFGAEPYFRPVLNGDEDLLVIPDERDAIWLELDGRTALAPLARTSSVQFTISVATQEAVAILNKFGERIALFLADFPQNVAWKKYITDSRASYRKDRFGGPLIFDSLEQYCQELVKHEVVCGAQLKPHKEVSNLNIPLFLRSVWWHFRLKRYANVLCIEVRPMARRSDAHIQTQLAMVMDIVAS
ncbi:MAG: hypothetical protein Q8Q32_02290 [bacterium]|nr:hypothetical protein [bacterium]